MLYANMNAKRLNRVLYNASRYSYGFIEGIKKREPKFNEELADYTIQVLGKYIDAQARANPQSLHHVYEWDRVGVESARLFRINARVSFDSIHLEGKFLQSKSDNGNGYVFRDKARIMENEISVTITPNNSSFLAFEDEGELVFTTNSVYIEHPGGDEVAGSFGKTVEEFFDSYFTNAFMEPLLKDLSTPEEYAEFFPRAMKGDGRYTGIAAATKYLDLKTLGAIE